MNNNNKEQRQSYPSRMPIKKFKSRRPNPGPIIAMTVLLLIIVAAIGFLVLSMTGIIELDGIFKNKPADNQTTPEETTAPPETTEPSETTESPDTTEPEETTEPVETPTPSDIVYKSQEFDYSDSKYGDLVLIDRDHEFVFPEYGIGQKIIKLYGNKSKSYVLSTSELELRRDVIGKLDKLMDAFYAETKLANTMVYNAYRSYERQEELYNNYVKKNGQEKADKYSAAPGHSDYHSGASFELRYIDESGKNHALSEKIEYAWITDNMYKYGFILRYPTNKAEITGNDFEPFHIRYVGEAHAAVMKEKDFCLEEYLEFLKGYPYKGEHLKVETSDNLYEIFYVAAPEDGSVIIPLPENRPYTLSGDNCGGFIVTVEVGLNT